MSHSHNNVSGSPSLPALLAKIDKMYYLERLVGQGSFGQVFKAYCRNSKQPVAIKYIKDAFANIQNAKSTYREISIMRKLTKMRNNLFTVKLIDIVLPDISVFEDEQQLKKEGVFIVMEWVDQDLRQLFSTINVNNFSQDHIKVILYNLLCTVNFLESANIMHRDIKPANILINSQCTIKICDFGMARSMPSEISDDFDICKLNNSGVITASSPQSQVMIPENQQSEEPSAASLFQKQNMAQRVQISQSMNQQRYERNQMVRQTSPHVASRWYRSPEIILTDRFYNSKCDVWSVGCVLAELINSLKINNQNTSSPMTPAEVYKGRVLFTGSSCHPLSPIKVKAPKDQQNALVIDSQDQMIQILRTLGTQSDLDFSFLSTQQAIDFIKQLQQSVQPTTQNSTLGTQLKDNFPTDTAPELLDLLQSCLEFNPQFRQSARKCLQHPMFDHIRSPQVEQGAPFKIFLKCDQRDSYDYQKEVDKTCGTVGEYYNMIVVEAEKQQLFNAAKQVEQASKRT